MKHKSFFLLTVVFLHLHSIALCVPLFIEPTLALLACLEFRLVDCFVVQQEDYHLKRA